MLRKTDFQDNITQTLDNMVNARTICNKIITALAQAMDKSKIFKVDI